MTSNNVTKNDVTSAVKNKRTNIEASLPILCDVCDDDVIIAPDVCHDEVDEMKRENIENSVDADNDYSFWIHVSEFVET